MTFDHMQGVLAFRDGELGHVAVALKMNDIVFDADDAFRVYADERVAADLLAAFDALQQESPACPLPSASYRPTPASPRSADQRAVDWHMVALKKMSVNLLA